MSGDEKSLPDEIQTLIKKALQTQFINDLYKVIPTFCGHFRTEQVFEVDNLRLEGIRKADLTKFIVDCIKSVIFLVERHKRNFGLVLNENDKLPAALQQPIKNQVKNYIDEVDNIEDPQKVKYVKLRGLDVVALRKETMISEMLDIITKVYYENEEEGAKLKVSQDYESWKEKLEETHYSISIGQGAFVRQDSRETVHFTSRELKTNLSEGANTCAWFCEEHFLQWLQDSSRRNYIDYQMYPTPAVCPEGYLNTWTGFPRSQQKITNFTEDEEEEVIDVFDRFIKHMSTEEDCSSVNENLEKYLKNYIAHIIQLPGVKPGVCLVKHGQEGTGKGTFDQLINKLISDKFYKQTSSSDSVVGHFTGLLRNLIFCSLDEATSIKMYESNDKLKNLITEPTHRIEFKGKDERIENSYVRLTINSNNENVVKIPAKQRRFLVIRPDKISMELADAVYELMGSDRKVQILFQYLENFELEYETLSDFQLNIPKTKALIDLQMHAMPNQYMFFCYLIQNRVTKDEEEAAKVAEKTKKPVEAPKEFTISNSDLWYEYNTFCTEVEIKQKIAASPLMKFMLKIDGVEKCRIEELRGKKINKERALKWLKDNNYAYISYE